MCGYAARQEFDPGPGSKEFFSTYPFMQDGTNAGIELPKDLLRLLKRLPPNRHGRRAHRAIITRYVRSILADRVRYVAKRRNRIEARLTPRDRVAARRTAP